MILEKHHDPNKQAYRKTLELALIIALSLASALFLVSRKVGYAKKKTVNVENIIMLAVDDIPVTRSEGTPRAPELPRVPLPSEDALIPEDATIGTTDLDFSQDIPLPDSDPGDDFEDEGYTVVGNVLPREVIGGFVELAIMVNYDGWVDSVRVVSNTTGEKAFEHLAVKTAFRTRYIDERAVEKNSRWIKRYFNFRKK